MEKVIFEELSILTNHVYWRKKPGHLELSDGRSLSCINMYFIKH